MAWGEGILIGDTGEGRSEFVGSGSGSGYDLTVLKGSAVGEGLAVSKGFGSGQGLDVARHAVADIFAVLTGPDWTPRPNET